MAHVTRSTGLRRLGIAALVAAVAIEAAPVQAQQYGSNFGWSYSTPRTTYYNGPAPGFYGPFGPTPYPYYGGFGGGNVQYFRRGRNSFWIETYRDASGRIRQRTGQFYQGGR